MEMRTEEEEHGLNRKYMQKREKAMADMKRMCRDRKKVK
jgi:hypothetical protein